MQETNNYRLAKLNDKDGIIKPGAAARWYIHFYAFDDTTQKLKQKRLYDINKIPTLKERYNFAQKQIAQINKLLKEGFTFKKESNRANESLVVLLTEILNLKSPTIRHRSIQSYQNAIRNFCKTMGKQPIGNIKRKDIFAYRDALLLEGKNPKTINNYVGFIKTLFLDMIQREWIEYNPFKGLTKLKERVSGQNLAFSTQQINVLKPLVKQDPNLWLAVQLMFYCFLRRNEVRQLQKLHFKLKQQQIFIPGPISKNCKSEHVTIPLHFCEYLKTILDKKNSKEYVISIDGTAPMGAATLTRRHRKLLEQFGWEKEGYTLYSWKHTGIVKAYKNGVDIKSLQLQCRHHDLSQTDTYLKTLGLYTNKAIVNNMPEL